MISSKIQSADWKSEKHAPVIECKPQGEKQGSYSVTVSVGKEIPHPNTTEHHISWIQLFFLPQDGTFPIQLGEARFTAHGESAQGANQGPAYSVPEARFQVTITGQGTLQAISYCNIHGLWQSEIPLA
ncbi:class II SORL domain-containing protein [Spirochaeta lutea]|uniref:Neelaredoxin n=1 Tax=Spirochaeta lutea TaxID=1480694 RepID=A0A098R2Q8_9SPIO|nr:class II SORL domain-containing protein [Spirochaeta lutea]KGE73953.1 Neelaredoxin [Spirochaeta lutea]